VIGKGAAKAGNAVADAPPQTSILQLEHRFSPNEVRRL
jgi:hypothetical protein